MTPLLGTRTPSAPVGDASAEDERASQVTASKVFTKHETRITNHESRPFFPPETGFLPRETGFLPPDCDFLPNHNGSKTRNSPQFVGIRRNSSDSDLRPEPLSAHRPHRQHGLLGFHETRDTNHGFYAFHESRPLHMAVRFAVGGQESHHQKPSTDRRALRQVTVFQFTIVRRSSLLFAIVRKKILSGASVPCPSTPATRPVGFSRITKHESRNTAFIAARSLLSCALWRNGCSAMERLWGGCGAAVAVERHGRPWSGMGGILPPRQRPCPVSGSRSASRRAPFAGKSHKSAQNPVSAGGCTRCAVARSSRRPARSFRRGGTQNEPMPGKENVLDCANRRTFYIALTRLPEHASERQAALFTLI